MTATKSQITKPPSDDVVLSVQGVSKKFCRSLKRSLFYGVKDIAGELTGIRKDNNELREGEFWALQDVSFELKKGESLGLVGANGSGKTTLLRIISGLIRPDRGSVKITGRVAPLIALGAGFNPILTGRENIYVNMSILGLSNEEIDDKFDEVVDFAEIGDAIDAPVQTYSSGMAARLGFACAIHTEPDILLIDEVLAVGDLRFRGKCFRKLANFKKKGITFILVSHNSHHIFQACNTSIYLSQGKILDSGDISYIVNNYEKDLSNVKFNQYNNKNISPKEYNKSIKKDVDIISVNIKDQNGCILKELLSGEQAVFCVNCFARRQIENINLTLVIRDVYAEDSLVMILSNLRDNKHFQAIEGNLCFEMLMPYVVLKPSRYKVETQLREGELYMLNGVTFFFDVDSYKNMSQCLFFQPRDWKLSA